MTDGLDTPSTPGAGIYAGLFLTALSTLMFEILLTRIFSVTMWYHFGFMAISIAMFGMTVGAILVYLFPRIFTASNNEKNLALSSVLFSLSILGAFLTHSNVPFINPVSLGKSAINIVITYIVIAIPFVFSGVAVCLALTRYGKDVGKLYAADLLGAGLGCLLLIPLLSFVDGPSAVIVVCSLAAAAGIFYASASSLKNVRIGSILLTATLAVLAVSNALLFPSHQQFIKLKWVHGFIQSTPLYEKWNSFSRITVFGDENELRRPAAWGLSAKWPEDKKVSELNLTIDAGADTVLTKFDGDFAKVEHLKYDLTNLVHYIRPDSKMLIIGVGGGRDLLSALKFKQKSVDGVEINNNIIDSVVRVFGDYSGHLDRYPNVRLFNDEARSFVGKSRDKYDIIQISLIDTLTASTAGAYVLTEHSLYTVQAWKSFLNHLNPDGVLTVSRWYFRKRPGEMLRLINLARTSLEQIGVQDVRKHIVLVAALGGGNGGRASDGIGTILVGRDPFTAHDLEVINKFAKDMGFEVILSPTTAIDKDTATVADGGAEVQKLAATYPLNIEPPTDDSPFFLHMLRLKDIFNLDMLNQGVMSSNPLAIGVLGILLATVIVLSVLCIVIPLALTSDKSILKGAGPLLTYFSSIGLGFMFVEVSQMQRLVVFLGHPVYALAVVLFTLLLASGVGSLSTSVVSKFTDKARLIALLIVLGAFGLLTPLLVSALDSSDTATRIAVSIAILVPLGFFMGMAFPIGMRIANQSSPKLTPWLWGINGAFSVCASVIAVAIALTFGISATFWTGTFCYVVALMSFRLTRAAGETSN
jgi:hypothetical protein